MNRTMKKPVGILCYVLLKVESFIVLTEFIILYYEVDFEILIILGRPFLVIGREFVVITMGKKKF